MLSLQQNDLAQCLTFGFAISDSSAGAFGTLALKGKRGTRQTSDLVLFVSDCLMKKWREKLTAADRESDEQFCASFDVTDIERQTLIIVRGILAELCSVDQEYIRSNSSTKDLHFAMTDGFVYGWDPLSFGFRFDKRTCDRFRRKPIPNLLSKKLLRDWIKEFLCSLEVAG